MDLPTNMFKHTFPIMLLGLALSWPVEASRTSTYGPVGGQDTLWTIATRLRPSNNVTVQQTMLALYHKNPQAFSGNNINSLMKGTRLQAPTLQETRRYQRLQALREARRQNQYWKRGIELPKITPPPIPKAAAQTRTKAKPITRSARPVSRTKTQTTFTPTPKKTERAISRLRSQLLAAQEKNQRLTQELQALQAIQTKGGNTPNISNQVKKLKTELDDLKSILDQKDNHIKTLQASLKSASEAIKAQHADNIRLYEKLKEVSPASVPAAPTAAGKPELKLATVQEDNAKQAAQTAAKATPAGETTQPADATVIDGAAKPANAAASTTTANVWADGKAKDSKQPEATTAATTTAGSAAPVMAIAEIASPHPATAQNESTTSTDVKAADTKPAATDGKDKPAPTEAKPADKTTSADEKTAEAKPLAALQPANDVKASGSVPLTEMLSKQAPSDKPAVNTTTRSGASPLALAIALISFFFILALIWRAFLQQRETRRIEQEEALIAEKMRKRLEDNQAMSTSADRKDPTLSPPSSLNF